jgi:hypothetical protein
VVAVVVLVFVIGTDGGKTFVIGKEMDNTDGVSLLVGISHDCRYRHT